MLEEAIVVSRIAAGLKQIQIITLKNSILPAHGVLGFWGFGVLGHFDHFCVILNNS